MNYYLNLYDFLRGFIIKLQVRVQQGQMVKWNFEKKPIAQRQCCHPFWDQQQDGLIYLHWQNLQNPQWPIRGLRCGGIIYRRRRERHLIHRHTPRKSIFLFSADLDKILKCFSVYFLPFPSTVIWEHLIFTSAWELYVSH